MSKWVLFLLFVVAVFLYLRFKSAPGNSASGNNAPRKTLTNKSNSKAQNSKKDGRAYHGVSIELGDGPCESVAAIAGQRFLSLDAPKIPLADCTVGSCQCKYVHYEDRREEESDRRGVQGLRTDLYERTGQIDRRKERNRREADK